MKKTFILLAFAMGVYHIVNAQCDKNIIMSASQTEYLDSTGKVERTVSENSTIEIKGKEIIITPGNEENVMKGQIKSSTCDWKQPFKEGKMVINTDLTRNGQMEARATTISIEGKDGKLTLVAKAEAYPNRIIRINLDKFVEQ